VIGLALYLLGCAVFLYVLFLVVRAAVREGVMQALRTDLLRGGGAWHGDGPAPPRPPPSFRPAEDDSQP
jgi:hypothetical protein